MKILFFVILALVNTAFAQVQMDDGRVPMNPSDTLKENECVFRQSRITEKRIHSLWKYDFIINSCDAKPTSSLTLWRDHLIQGYCAFDLVQKMSGNIITRVMMLCPTQPQNEPQIQIDNINDDEIEALPPGPQEEEAKAPVVVKKKITKKAAPEQNQNAEVQAEKDNQETPEIKNYVPPEVDQDF